MLDTVPNLKSLCCGQHSGYKDKVTTYTYIDENRKSTYRVGIKYIDSEIELGIN